MVSVVTAAAVADPASEPVDANYFDLKKSAR
jgi:hypothetical protein